jgi:spore cortex biosynthesis protein YabQ
MLYLPSLADQTKLFLLSLGFGFALGVLYDVFRVLRLVFLSGKRRQILVQDILYAVICTLATFFFFLAAGDGALRFYTAFAVILGWLIYYISLGTVAVMVTDWAVRVLEKLLDAVWLLISAPLRFVLRGLRKLLRGVGGKAKKAKVRLQKKIRFATREKRPKHLTDTAGIRYNDQENERTYLSAYPDFFDSPPKGAPHEQSPKQQEQNPRRAIGCPQRRDVRRRKAPGHKKTQP